MTKSGIVPPDTAKEQPGKARSVAGPQILDDGKRRRWTSGRGQVPASTPAPVQGRWRRLLIVSQRTSWRVQN
jgi:hypothetical protein